jgi:hypothetical protein
MADPKNPGQFGNRSDTEKQASKGGKASGGSNRGSSSRASGAAGRTQAAKRGGENSRRNS